MPNENTSFAFGKNWSEFVRVHFSQERIEIAKGHLLNFLELEDLEGKTFLDIGCGSGIHSLAACRAKAERVISFDYDQHSVQTTQRIQAAYGSQHAWEVYTGSILDAAFIKTLRPAHVVYSWGVLHHTGDLWQAMRNAASLLLPGGLFYIAIYDKTPDTPYWIGIKKRYNAAGAIRKKLMELSYVWENFFRTVSPRRMIDSILYIKNYQKNRGMAFLTDIKDWLGGWPYEPASEAEVCDFCVHALGLDRIKVKTGEANIEYLFRAKP